MQAIAHVLRSLARQRLRAEGALAATIATRADDFGVCVCLWSLLSSANMSHVCVPVAAQSCVPGIIARCCRTFAGGDGLQIAHDLFSNRHSPHLHMLLQHIQPNKWKVSQVISHLRVMVA